MPHYIRLRGPWNYRPLARWLPTASGDWQLVADNLLDSGIISLPGDWRAALGDFAGTVLFTRTFRCPESLASATRVWLGVEEVSSQARVELNDQFLGEIVCSQTAEGNHHQQCPARFDITELLQPRNLVAITLTSPTPTPTERRSGHLGLVRLEIE